MCNVTFLKFEMNHASISDVLLYDKTFHILDTIEFEDLTPNEMIRMNVRGKFENICNYKLYNDRIICSEDIDGKQNTYVLKTIDELKTRLRKLPELMKIVKITKRKNTTSLFDECISSRMINKCIDMIPDEYSTMHCTIQHETGYISNMTVRKDEKYYVSFDTSLNDDELAELVPPVVEFYKCVKSHKIAMGHIKRAIAIVCPFAHSLVVATTIKKTVLFDMSTISLETSPKKFHEELVHVAWNPDRLAMCVGEDEYKEIVDRWN